MQVNIVDSIMGSGKTTAAINYINASDNECRFMYVTPYLSEVQRIIESCPSKHFQEPKEYGTKIRGIKDLLNKGKNIATTHTLFHLFDQEIIDLCYSQGYVLIMDEVTDVIEPLHIKPMDLDTLLEKYIYVDDNCLVRWREDKMDYTEKTGDAFLHIKHLCELGCLAAYGDSYMIWMFPVQIFNAFRESYILTYMFHAQMQKYYYDFHDIKYRYLFVTGDNIRNYSFSEEPVEHVSKYDYRELIHICNDSKLNMIGDADYSLSKSWYKRNEGNSLIVQLKKNTYNFFNNRNSMYDAESDEMVASKSSNNLWTTFKDFRNLLAGKGYTKGFCSSNMRATNEFRARTTIAYLVNKYINPYIKSFFLANNIPVYEDEYAISEMVQFLWRSGIRDGKHIVVYIPSQRMRNLLQEWIDEQKYEDECIDAPNTQ